MSPIKESRFRTSENGDEQDVRELLRSAGRRPEPPSEDMAVIRAAARSAWQELVEEKKSHRSMPPLVRGLALAATLVAAVLAGWIWQSRGPAGEGLAIATLEASFGEVLIGATAAEVGAELWTGTEIVTASSGSAGRAALRLNGGQSLRLDAGTSLRFKSPSSVELVSGAIYVDSPASVPDEASLLIATPLGSVLEVGTQYEVRLNGGETMRVRVREGSVTLTRGGVEYAAVRGESLEVEPDGSVSRATIEPYGDEWRWVLEAAPGLDIEGRTLESFLNWVERETAWEIRYQDAALEASAAEIRFDGTIENLLPDESSVAAILRASNLAHRIEDGTLFITRP